MRHSGFQWPWHPLQVLSWILIVLFVVEFYGCYVPIIPYGWNIAVGIIMGLLLGTSIITSIIIMVKDPMDQNVKKGHNPDKFKVTGKHVIDENYFCSLCQANVGKKSKHCKLCNKCVNNFDHHCKWLNTCIGGRNYRIFITYLTTTFIGSVVHGGIGVAILVEYATDQRRINLQVLQNYGMEFQPIAYIIVVVVFVVLSIPAVYLLGQLFFFHMQLIRRGISTYDYILEQRANLTLALEKEAQKKKEKEAQSDTLPRTRTQSLMSNTSMPEIEELPSTPKKVLPPIRQTVSITQDEQKVFVSASDTSEKDTDVLPNRIDTSNPSG